MGSLVQLLGFSDVVTAAIGFLIWGGAGDYFAIKYPNAARPAINQISLVFAAPLYIAFLKGLPGKLRQKNTFSRHNALSDRHCDVPSATKAAMTYPSTRSTQGRHFILHSFCKEPMCWALWQPRTLQPADACPNVRGSGGVCTCSQCEICDRVSAQPGPLGGPVRLCGLPHCAVWDLAGRKQCGHLC